MRVEGKADRTLVLFGQSIRYFSAWREGCDLAADVSNLIRDNVLHWLDQIRGKGQTAGTIQTRSRGLRRFVNWCLAEDIIDTDPLAGIVIDKPEPPPVPVLTDDELAALIGACKRKGFRERRDEAVMRLLIDCGLRASEVTGIDIADLGLDGETVRVTGKGSRVRQA